MGCSQDSITTAMIDPSRKKKKETRLSSKHLLPPFAPFDSSTHFCRHQQQIPFLINSTSTINLAIYHQPVWPDLKRISRTLDRPYLYYAYLYRSRLYFFRGNGI